MMAALENLVREMRTSHEPSRNVAGLGDETCNGSSMSSKLQCPPYSPTIRKSIGIKEAPPVDDRGLDTERIIMSTSIVQISHPVNSEPSPNLVRQLTSFCNATIRLLRLSSLPGMFNS